VSEDRDGDRPFSATDLQLKRKFEYAADFGIGGNDNRLNAVTFAEALAAHVSDPASSPVVIRSGRGGGGGGFGAICYVQEWTWLAVVTTMAGPS